MTSKLGRFTPWLIGLGLTGFGLLGWLRPIGSGSGESSSSEPRGEGQLGERFAEAGYAERVRFINRFGQLADGAGARPLI